MKPPTVHTWETKLTRLSAILLAAATAYGIVAGAGISLLYDVVPNMSSLEDKLAPIQGGLFLCAVLVSLPHLPLAMSDAIQRRWEAAWMRGMVVAGPLVVFLGTEGLISHFILWGPFSATDRYHMLHHSLVAGAPLTIAYWLFLRKRWDPAKIRSASSLTPRAMLLSGLALILATAVVGVLAGLGIPTILGASAVIGLAMVLVSRQLASSST